MAGSKKEIGTGFITEVDRYLFNNGRHYEIFEKMGAHPKKYKGKSGMYFAVWAPHAEQIGVVGDFNSWNPEANPMQPLADSGIWEAFVPGIATGELYKYAITTKSGKILFKADPYAFSAEYRPGTASVTTDISGFQWSDDAWMEKRGSADPLNAPMSIYEVHLGSWRRKNRPEKDGCYTYVEAAKELADYVTDMGYTHVELMGIAEHPYDGSWGYQVTGYFAPTSRYGTPQEFMYFINYLHKKGIGVILDWVPAHFPRDAHGLSEFDGEALYEYADPRKGEHPDWGTKVFDYSKYEVDNFLIANAIYWVEKYHVDGLRVDAVASMLYLDYGRENGNWIPNKYGGNENLEAIEFFKHFNSVIRGTFPGVMTIAEESTAWPMVTGPIDKGGLDFSFKWNMGWMHDFCEYMKLDPYFRKNNHYSMTFAMSYNSAENYILPLSHDEVVHLKCSMVNKMPGLRADKYANLRAGYTYMFGHEGKKLLFMGQEFAQEREWSEERELDWYMLQDELNSGMLEYVKFLLNMYRKYPCLHEIDNDWNGFEWVNADDAERSTYSFIRKASDGKNNLLFVLNMTPVERKDYCVGVPRRKNYRLVLNSDDKQFGGNGAEIPASIRATSEPCDYKPYRITFDLPASSALVFVF